MANPFLLRDNDPIPRYLWRAYSASSDGINTTTEFKSAAASPPRVQSQLLDQMPVVPARQALCDHVLWRSVASDNLVSFASSLLWVLQHAIRKSYVDYHGRRRQDLCQPGCSCLTSSNVTICFLDTAKVPKDTFSSTVSHLRRLGLDERVNTNLLHAYHAAEYLAEGSLNVQGASVHVPLRRLITAGLFDLLPALSIAQHRWQLVKAINYLRDEYLNYEPSSPINNEEVAISREIAACFGTHFERPVLLFLLALRRRSVDGPILRELGLPVNSLAGNSVSSKSPGWFWRDAGDNVFDKRPHESVPETRQVLNLMSIVDQPQCGSKEPCAIDQEPVADTKIAKAIGDLQVSASEMAAALDAMTEKLENATLRVAEGGSHE